MAHIRVLADPRLRGRFAGTVASLRAAAYIADRFRQDGLRPAFADFFQRFEMPKGHKLLKAPNAFRHQGLSPAQRLWDRNVVAKVPGCGEQVLLLGAHFDHRGMHGGKLHPGADDNASGVAVMLEVARLLARERRQKSVYFVAFGAEESGYLYGSRHFVAHAPFPLRQLTLMVNLDMVGRALFERGLENRVPMGLAVIGQRLSATLKQQVSTLAKQLGLTPWLVHERFMGTIGIAYRYDAKPFIRKGIPTLFFSTSVHRDFHRPSDTVDKLRPDKIRRVAELVLVVLRQLAGRVCR